MDGAPAAALPLESVPFPVAPAYRIGPDLRRLQAGAGHFITDERWPDYLVRKLHLLETDARRCRVASGSQEALMDALWRVAQLLAREQPHRFRLNDERLAIPDLGLSLYRPAGYEVASDDDGSRRCAPRELRERALAHLRRLAPADRLADALALAVQEDLVIVSGPPGEDRAELLHVCLPSHWNPGEREGASFAALHAPVPHNRRLLAGSRKLVSAMLSKGPFERFVWSLTGDADLDQNPTRERASLVEPSGDPIDQLWFRAERQTTTALPTAAGESAGSGSRRQAGSGRALFTIRIYVAPLREVLDPSRAALMATAIRSMDQELLRYKGLEQRRNPLLASLDAIAGARARPASNETESG